MAANEQQQQKDDGERGREPAHHARRPMNAFLIFCKKHRTSVRSHFPNLENRAVTRVLGEWWATLHPEQKESYINLAQEYKDAFLNANPDFKWYKLPAPPLRTLITRPTNKTTRQHESGSNDYQISELLERSYDDTSSCSNSAIVRKNDSIQPGKLADESQIGGLSSLFTPEKNRHHTQSESMEIRRIDNTIRDNESDDRNIPKPPKKRYAGMPIKFEHKQECRVDLFNSCKIDGESNNNEDHVELNVKTSDETNDANLLGETNNYRGGERSCKGLRYQKFLAEQHRSSLVVVVPQVTQSTKRPRLCCEGLLLSGGGTEKTMMNERRNSISSNVSEKTDSLSSEGGNNSTRSDLEHLVDSAECRVEASRPEDTETEEAEAHLKYPPRNSRKRFKAEDFNLEKKIEALPSLSLEEFQEKKKQQRTKKKNIQQQQQQQQQQQEVPPAMYSRGHSNRTLVGNKTERTMLVGSQKRKARKQCITRNASSSATTTTTTTTVLVKDPAWCASADMEGLACLAEMAANRTKLTK